MIFAAKEAVERKARERDRKMMEMGEQAGEQSERERIKQLLEQQGVEVPPEVMRMIDRESDSRS